MPVSGSPLAPQYYLIEKGVALPELVFGGGTTEYDSTYQAIGVNYRPPIGNVSISPAINIGNYTKLKVKFGLVGTGSYATMTVQVDGASAGSVTNATTTPNVYEVNLSGNQITSLTFGSDGNASYRIYDLWLE